MLFGAIGEFAIGEASAVDTYSVAAGVGEFTLSGQAAGLRAARILTAGAGAFALSGQDAALEYGRKVAAGQGAFILTGQSVSLRVGYRLVASPFPETARAHVMFSALGAVPLGGGRLRGRITFALRGENVNLRATRRTVAGAGSFILSGGATNYAIHKKHIVAISRAAVSMIGRALGAASIRGNSAPATGIRGRSSGGLGNGL